MKGLVNAAPLATTMQCFGRDGTEGVGGGVMVSGDAVRRESTKEAFRALLVFTNVGVLTDVRLVNVFSFPTVSHILVGINCK